MEINKVYLEGVYEIECDKFVDDRGCFIKVLHDNVFRETGLDPEFRESFYSISKKNVIRGMHFQIPPFDHNKLVYVVDGEILDVALDIREESTTYGEFYTTLLSSENNKALYMEKGFAHGFLTVSEKAIVTYLTSTVYSNKHDDGIKWDSFGFSWPVDKPIVSKRDSSHFPFKKLK